MLDNLKYYRGKIKQGKEQCVDILDSMSRDSIEKPEGNEAVGPVGYGEKGSNSCKDPEVQYLEIRCEI